MNLKKFFSFFILMWLAFFLLKMWLLNGTVFANPVIQDWVYYLLTAAVTVALFRRFGIITYIEAVFALIFYSLGFLFFDLIITTNYLGYAIFQNLTYWWGFLAMILAAMFFHKKRHIHLRHELHAHHHGDHGHKSHGDHHQPPHGQHGPGKTH